MLLQNLQLEFSESLFAQDQPLDFILPAQNMRIYQQQVIVYLVNALRKTYPLVLRMVGDDFFQLAAIAYSKQYPSRSGDLNEYGEYFSDFLAEYQPVKDLIYLAEVAQFEWICHTLLSAGVHAPMTFSVWKNFQPEQYEQLHFSLHPACKVMKFYYPILHIIELCETEVPDSIELGNEGNYLLMMRRESDLNLVTLTVAEFTFLSLLQDNKSLATALSAALDVDSSFDLDAQLERWVEEQVMVECWVS
jgi:hypothetical protein